MPKPTPNADPSKKAPDPAAPPPQDPPALQFATKEELGAVNTALQNITSEIGKLGSRMEGYLAGRREGEPPKDPDPPKFQRTVTKEQIRAAVDEGDHAKALTLQAQYSDESLQEMQQTFSTQMTAMQNQGLALIGNLTKSTTADKLPHYARFKDKIDALVNTLDPNIRANPESYKWAHDTIVGQNMQTIVDEAVETALRKQTEGETEGSQPSGKSGRDTTGDAGGKLTMDQVYGKDNADNIRKLMRNSKINADQYARRMGYDDEQAMLKSHKAHYDAEEKGEAANE